MNEEWLLMNFQEFLNKLLMGDILIQDHINVLNIRRDTSCKVSFLNYLLSYNNINKDNILGILAEIYNNFYELMNQLKNNEAVQKMIERINGEWYETDNFIVIENPITNEYFDNLKENEILYQKSYQVFEEINHLSKIENNIPLQVEKDNSHPMKKHFKQFIFIYKETIDKLTSHLNETEQNIQHFKGQNLNFLLDLSIKHKQFYLKISDVDKIEGIPENIHGVFSNYIYIQNLLLKQLIQYFHILKERLSEINEKLDKVKIMQQNIETIAYFKEKQEYEKLKSKDKYLKEDIDSFF
tara:strand:+ start:335 stop:1225 length:891 start_codon:yes stop_codon:yes gene_type:complete